MPSNWLIAILIFVIAIMSLLFLGYEHRGQVRPQHCRLPEEQHGNTEHTVFAGVAFSFHLPTYNHEPHSVQVNPTYLYYSQLEHFLLKYFFLKIKS